MVEGIPARVYVQCSDESVETVRAALAPPAPKGGVSRRTLRGE